LRIDVGAKIGAGLNSQVGSGRTMKATGKDTGENGSGNWEADQGSDRWGSNPLCQTHAIKAVTGLTIPEYLSIRIREQTVTRHEPGPDVSIRLLGGCIPDSANRLI